MELDTLLAVIFCLVVPGIIGILHSLWLLSGKGFKGFYMTNNIYTGRVYTAIPFGIAFLFFAAATIPEDIDTGLVIGYIGVGFGVLGLIFAFIQPSFLKPAWFKWLEREHGDILPLLIQDANQVGLKAWDEAIKTQEDMEIWVAEVRRKYGR